MNTLKVCIWICLAETLFVGLACSQAIQGTVFDDQGEPISGAVIYAVDSQARLRVDNNEVVLPEKFPRVLSDRNGSFAFPPLKRPVKILLVRDMEDRFAWLADPMPGNDTRIVVQPPAGVIGRLWRGKSPLAQKEITATLTPGTCHLSYRATARTDQEGRFVFDSLPPGKYRFQTISPVPQVGCCFRSVPTREVEVTLHPAQSHTIRIGGSDLPCLRGKVTDTGGSPLHGVWVYLTSNTANSVGAGSWSDITTREGDFAIYDIPPGPYTLHCFRRLALNNSSRTLQTTQPVTIKDRFKSNTPAVAFAENISNISIDLTPFMPLEIGKPIPPLKRRTLTGNEFNIEHERGKIVVLHFYASWCIPCVKDFPNYDKLLDRFGREKLTVVGINLDDTLEECQLFLKKQSPRHPQLFAGPWGDSWAVKDFHIANVPTTLIVDPEGNIIQTDLFSNVLDAFVETHLTRGSHKP
jgi:thiol-disulfide isomerase/thioredoxin